MDEESGSVLVDAHGAGAAAAAGPAFASTPPVAAAASLADEDEGLETVDAFKKSGPGLHAIKKSISDRLERCFTKRKGSRVFTKAFHSRSTGIVIEACSADYVVATRPPFHRASGDIVDETNERLYDAREILIWRYTDDFLAAAAGTARENAVLWRVLNIAPSKGASGDNYLHYDALYRVQTAGFDPATGCMTNILWVFDPVDGPVRIDLDAAVASQPHGITWYPHVGLTVEPPQTLPRQWFVCDEGMVASIPRAGFCIFPWAAGLVPRAVLLDGVHTAANPDYPAVAFVKDQVMACTATGNIFVAPLDATLWGAIRAPKEAPPPGERSRVVDRVAVVPRVWKTITGLLPTNITVSRTQDKVCIIGLDGVAVVMACGGGTGDLMYTSSQQKSIRTAKFGGLLLFMYYSPRAFVVTVPATMANMPYYHTAVQVSRAESDNFTHSEEPLTVIESPSGPVIMMTFNSRGHLMFTVPRKGPLSQWTSSIAFRRIQRFLDSAQCTDRDGEPVNTQADAEYRAALAAECAAMAVSKGETMSLEDARKMFGLAKEEAAIDDEDDDDDDDDI